MRTQALENAITGDGRHLQVVVVGDENSVRLDRVLALRCPDLSRSRLKALILAGQVATKGSVVRDPAYHVSAGDTITIDVPPAIAAEPEGEDIALNVIYEDEDIVVIDKPRGLVVHPAAGHETGTLVNALIAHCGASLSGIGGVKRPGIVHRLDKDTTGLMVVAKNDAAHQSLTAQFADHGRTNELRRGYMAFAWGAIPNRPTGTIVEPIDRHPHAREKMAVRDGGREAMTHWEVPCRNSRAATASRWRPRCWPASSRPAAPIRSAFISPISSHPLMGDDTYGLALTRPRPTRWPFRRRRRWNRARSAGASRLFAGAGAPSQRRDSGPGPAIFRPIWRCCEAHYAAARMTQMHRI